jgi:biotin carboxyl carrier protein
MIDVPKASVLALLLGLALLPSPASPSEFVATHDDVQVPHSIVQGGLLRGKLPPGSKLALLLPFAADAPAGGSTTLPIRVSSDGQFVLGVARDEAGPIRLSLTLPDRSDSMLEIPVIAREWQIERVEGVPEATVNPPPDIAARIEREQAEVSAVRQRDDDRDDFEASFDWPLTGRISGVYGSQRIYNGTPKSPHSGLDVAAAKGTPVHAPAGGIVSFANPDLYLTGGTVLIDHGHGLSSNFLHLSRIDVRVGQRVEQGQVIGLVGATGRATGPHMHWGMNWFTVRIDPQLLVDPAKNPVGSSPVATPSR